MLPLTGFPPSVAAGCSRPARPPAMAPCHRAAANGRRRHKPPQLFSHSLPNGGSASSAVGAPLTSQTSLEFLHSAGFAPRLLQSVTHRCPKLAAAPVERRVRPLLSFLLEDLGFSLAEVQVMLLRCPDLFSYDVASKAAPAVQFLRELGLDGSQVGSVVRRFPPVLGLGVKAHLCPQVAYLKSLGVSEEALPGLVLARPQVLSNSIDRVVHYLNKWLSIKRTNVGRLLRTYPYDWHLPVMQPPPAPLASADEDEEQKGGPPAGAPPSAA